MGMAPRNPGPNTKYFAGCSKKRRAAANNTSEGINRNGGHILPGRPPFYTRTGSIDVNSIHERSAPVNTAADHEREFLTKALNSAIARARLTTNSLEAIAAALRHKQSTIAEVRTWLADEGLGEASRSIYAGRCVMSALALRNRACSICGESLAINRRDGSAGSVPMPVGCARQRGVQRYETPVRY